MAGSIFISYRRSDTVGHAKNLHDHLAQWFDADELFFDSEHINPGEHFPQRLADAIGEAKVVLVLVGPDWLAEINRRAVLTDADFVRVEIELALRRQTETGRPSIIPVLLGLPTPPSPTDLHPSLQSGVGPLFSLDFHSFQGKNADWNNQFVRLRALIAGVTAVPAPRFRPPADDTGRQRVVVHTRPPLIVDDFRDRLAQRQRLSALVKAASPLCVVVSGRAGIGKTALLSQFLIALEADSPLPLDFLYFSAAGSVPLSVDLLRAFLKSPGSNTPDTPPPESQPGIPPSRRRTVIAIDQAELLLDAEGGWRVPHLQDVLNAILDRANVMLVIGTRIVPATAALAGFRIEYVPIDDGLPLEDARALLCAADFDQRLGFQADPVATGTIIHKVGANPRMLELAIAVLTEDPLTTPASLAQSMASYSDPVRALLRESYASATDTEKALLLLLAVAARALPMALIRACLADGSADLAVRTLSKRHLARVERGSQSVQIAPLDAEYLLGAATWTPKAIRRCHVLLARRASELIRSGFFSGRAEDVWRLQAVEHYLRGGEPAKASAELASSQEAGLEAHGLYDQLIRLHEELATTRYGDLGQRYSALLHLATLSGDKEKALALLRRLTETAPAPLEATRGALALEMGAAFRDLDRPRDGLHHLLLARRSPEPDIAAGALSAIAQILRRRGSLDLGTRVLDRALGVLEGSHGQTRAGMAARALVLHQQAQMARFSMRADHAHTLLEDAFRLSESAEDAGGMAYRHSLRAALDSDALALESAAASLSKAIATYDEIGDKWGNAAALYALAQIRSDLGDARGALDLADRSRSLARASGNTRVECLLAGLALTLKRRSGATDQTARQATQHAMRRLEAAGFRLYARRLAYELALDLCLAGEVPVRSVTALLPPEVTQRADIPVVYMLRPLAAGHSLKLRHGLGLARDAEQLGNLLADSAGQARAE